MSDDHSKPSRRKFVGSGLTLGAAATVAPYAALCEAIFSSFLRDAHAEMAGASVAPRNFINVAAIGAPCRYAFDHWARVNDTDAPLAFNPSVATRLAGSGGRYSETVYETFKVDNLNASGVLVPSFFRGSVTTAAGVQPLTDLLNNMLVIRGYGTNVDGHPSNHATQLMPLNGAPSITGLAADASKHIFSAVRYPDRGPFTTFNSAMGKSISTVGNPALKSLMFAFGPTANTKVPSLKAIHANTIQYYHDKLRLIAGRGDATSRALASSAENARKLIQRGVSDIDAYWAPAVARYKDIIEAAFRVTSGVYGISDQPIMNTRGTTATGLNVDDLFNYQTSGTATNFYRMSPDYDVRTGLSASRISYYAEGLALAEYLITQKLGGVLEIMLPSFDNVSAEVFKDPTTTTVSTETAAINHDMHTTGAVLMVTYTNALFRGYAAGVLELARVLKAIPSGSGNAWTDTIVHLTSDFGRIPRNDGSGSDHGFNQMVTSVISGCIANGPMVVGNVSNQGLFPGSYDGSQGVGAPIEGYNQLGRPSPIMAASTIAALMRVPHNVFQNLAEPLVKMVADRAQYSSFGQGKTVP